MTLKGPNKYPEPRTKAQREALADTCKYLGKTFDDGETICYQGARWICSGGSWHDTGQSC